MIFLNDSLLQVDNFAYSGLSVLTDVDIVAMSAAGDPPLEPGEDPNTYTTPNWSATGTAYVDNFQVTVIPEPSSMALLLAAVGLYGVTFVSVTQRIPEMGVRRALGASPQDIVWLILKQGFKKTAIGLGVGLALGWGLGKALESALFQVRPEDPVTFTAIPLFLLAVSLLAYLVPACRASRVDPVEALRDE